ncbi:MAG TPA: uroporphyrinogen decarboxylase family protein [Candidatus Hydrogenedentes bacterium]|nr:uroporphyrinogen decarboxylase family protein [Candidatus Hydrogenedentota bacterium]
MNGVENFTRAIEHTGPEYPPVLVGVDLSVFHEQDAAKADRIRELLRRIPDDLLNLSPEYRGTAAPVTEDGVTRWRDHWGTGWVEDGHGAKTEWHPLEAGYELLDDYAFPDPHAPGLFDRADAQLAERRERYVLGSVWFTLFERLWMLRGFNNMLVDPYLYPEAFAALRDHIVDFNLAIIDAWLARGAHGVYFSDDWGSQRGLLIDPDDWRAYYRPSYDRMFRRVREGGAHVWMHLCGNITAILPDLIDMGLNVLNPVQPQAMNIEELARDFGGKVCFFGGADVQGVLVRGTPAEVRNQAERLLRLFACRNGGYIASTSHGLMPETPLDNVIALLETFTAHASAGRA